MLDPSQPDIPNSTPDSTQPDLLAKESSQSTWTGFGIVLILNLSSFVICALVSPKQLWLFTFTWMPFTQLLYVIPLLIHAKKNKEKRLLRGVLFAMLLTFAPLIILSLLAMTGLALCSLILVGGALMNHR